MAGKFEQELMRRQSGGGKFKAELDRRQSDRLGPITRSIVEGVASIPGAVAGAVRGQQDPAFKGVGGLDLSSIRDPEVLSAVERTKLTAPNDKQFGETVKRALGDRLLKSERDRFGQEVITFRGDDGQAHRQFINAPGLEGGDVDRAVAGALPFIATGLGIGGLTRASALPIRAGAQAVGQAGAALGQDIAADRAPDPVRMGLAGAGGTIGELLSPMLTAATTPILRRLAGRDSVLVAADGSLTRAGQQAIDAAGIDPESVTPEFLRRLQTPEAVRAIDRTEAAIKAQTDQFGIRTSRAQRTLDPGALSREEQARRGLAGLQAREIVKDFDRAQQADVARAATGIAEDLGGAVPETIADTGQAIQQGLRTAEDAGNTAITQAFKDVRVERVFPEGIPQTAFADLGRKVEANLQNLAFDEALTPAAVDAVKMLRNFSKGEHLRPAIGIGGDAATPPPVNFDTIRRRLLQTVNAAGTKADVASTLAVKRAYNDWVEGLAKGALESGDPVEFAKLQGAIQLTAKTKKLFEKRGPNDAGGALMRQIIDRSDSPEGVVTTLFGAGVKEPKTGALGALQRIRAVLSKNDPEAWEAVRM